MNLILKKVKLSENVHCYTFLAPEIVKKAKPGQFVIMRVEDGGERIPFTVCAKDAATGGLSILIQTVGAETRKLSYLNEGDFIAGLVGPLGKPTDLGNPKRVLLISGGIGASVLYHQSTALKADGIPTDLIAGARNKDLIIFENEFRENCDKAYIMTDDGSGGQKGLVTDKLRELLENGENYDVVFAV
ncbi:MAG: sulfide/dihydroorotate dehydrogenase-like FAD/NAD-binding protein, partial [Christensenellaceae bacterium]|nr:sulfide/dihydroorotate dehydrogenase-like FAD/NAD-binding protein [Christensenellaceae bacterium]